MSADQGARENNKKNRKYISHWVFASRFKLPRQTGSSLLSPNPSHPIAPGQAKTRSYNGDQQCRGHGKQKCSECFFQNVKFVRVIQNTRRIHISKIGCTKNSISRGR